MSQENVEIVRSGYEAFNRGDFEGVAAEFASDFEYVASGAIPGTGGVYRGPQGYRRFQAVFWDEFADARAEVNELIEAGDQVLASATFRGRGKQSGVETAWDVWQLWTVQHGKVRTRPGIHEQGRSPRSRWAAGVGAVLTGVGSASRHP